ncbi:MAG: hypothetical protein U0625_12740 [Phycisphaerales bacterium]
MKAIFNVDAALRFAEILEREADELARRTAAMSESLVGLAATWRDPKYDLFQRKFDDASLALKQCLERSEHYAAYLRKKAAIVKERYLRD